MKKEEKNGLIFGLILGLVFTAIWIFTREPIHFRYSAIYQDGYHETAKNLVVIPLMSENDIEEVWPKYIVETDVKVPKLGKVTFRSKPFILTDNPDIQGEYNGQMVYYVEKPGRY